MAQDVADAFEIEQEGPIIVEASHQGQGHFGVELSDISGINDERLINTVGEFDGTVMAPVQPGDYVFEVSYDQSYSLEMVGFGEIETAPVSISRTDPDILPIEIEDPIKIDLRTSDQGVVQVSLRNYLGQKVDSIFNEVGPAETTAMIRQTGQAFLFFDIVGTWEADIETV